MPRIPRARAPGAARKVADVAVERSCEPAHLVFTLLSTDGAASRGSRKLSA